MKHADITITPQAQAHLEKQLAQQDGAWLRLALREAGCSGLEYTWQAVDAPEDGDLRIPTGSALSVCVDGHDYQRALHGLTIDSEQDLLSASLTYRNPNQSGTCGCGVSFTVS